MSIEEVQAISFGSMSPGAKRRDIKSQIRCRNCTYGGKWRTLVAKYQGELELRRQAEIRDNTRLGKETGLQINGHSLVIDGRVHSKVTVNSGFKSLEHKHQRRDCRLFLKRGLSPRFCLELSKREELSNCREETYLMFGPIWARQHNLVAESGSRDSLPWPNGILWYLRLLIKRSCKPMPASERANMAICMEAQKSTIVPLKSPKKEQ